MLSFIIYHFGCVTCTIPCLCAGVIHEDYRNNYQMQFTLLNAWWARWWWCLIFIFVHALKSRSFLRSSPVSQPVAGFFFRCGIFTHGGMSLAAVSNRAVSCCYQHGYCAGVDQCRMHRSRGSRDIWPTGGWGKLGTCTSPCDVVLGEE